MVNGRTNILDAPNQTYNHSLTRVNRDLRWSMNKNLTPNPEASDSSTILLDRRLLRAVIHDLRSPMRIIAFYAQMLGESLADLDAIPTESKQNLDTIILRTDELLQLLEVFSRYLALAQEPYIPRLTPVRPIVEIVSSNVRNHYQNKITTVAITGKLPGVLVQPEWLIIVFSALLDNGLKFNESPEPRVEIGYTSASDAIAAISMPPESLGWGVFSVRDNGIGIPPEYARQVFFPLERLHSKSKYPGAGMGLALCDRIIRKTGGWITIDSPKEGGTLVHFSLPIQPDQTAP